MNRRFLFYFILFQGFEHYLSVRPDSDVDVQLSLEAGGNESNDGALTVTHRGAVHRDERTHGPVAATSPLPLANMSIVASPPPPPLSRGVLQKVGGGLLEILHGGRRMKSTEAAKVALKPHDVLIFYGVIYAMALISWLCFRYLEFVKINFSKVLRQAAMIYWRWSRLAPIVACTTLYVLADMLAIEAGKGDDKGAMCWKFALVAATAIFNTLCSRRFYMWLDGYIEEGDGWRHKLKQVAIMQGAHLLIYLPLGVPLFTILADFVNRSASDTVTNCSTSALAGIPRHLADSTAMAAEELPLSYSSSVIFWPASNFINFMIIQTWSPGFKSTWDALMAVAWNAYIMAVKSDAGDPVAIGPMLGNRDVLTPDLSKQESSLDCKRFSLVAIFWFIADVLVWIAETTKKIVIWIYETSKWAWHKWCVFSIDTYHMIKTNLYLLGCYIKRKSWESWCVGCYIVRRTYIVTWTIFSYVCAISFRIVSMPFKIFDSVKWYMGMFWVPRFWDYDTCPCPKADFDSSWTDAGVIWDGEVFGNMDMGKK